MSPVFAHGRLRLYLLKLLEESPRHGYEVIRLLQDRFLGVYSPSPGTIYPRLARLEEEGLVTHEVVRGKKVYSLTDKGRAELVRRFDELAALEEDVTATAQQFAQGVREDVRETVRSMREELSSTLRGDQSWKDMRWAWAPARPGGLDEVLRAFVTELREVCGEGGPSPAQLAEIKSGLDATVARVRTQNRT